MTKIYLPLLALALNFSCSKEDSKTEAADTLVTPTEPFISAADIAKPATVVPLAPTDVDFVLLTNSDLFEKKDRTSFGLFEEANEIGSEGEKEEEACIKQLSTSAKGKVVDGKFIYAAAFDFLPCVGKAQVSSDGQNTDRITSSTVKIYAEFTCEGADLSSLDGKGMEEIGSMDSLCKGNMTMLTHFNTSIRANFTENGNVLTFEIVEFHAESGPDNTHCKLNYDATLKTTSSDCQTVNKSVSSYNGALEANYLKTIPKDLKSNEASMSRWFSSGSIDLEINDWSGSMTFNGENSPSYTLTKGAETKSGTLSFGANLRATAWKNGISEKLAKMAAAAHIKLQGK